MKNGEDEQTPLLSKSLSTYSLRSEMAQEIISRQPGFIENWALVIFLGLLLLMLGATWFVHYPDIISSRAVLTAKNAPKELIVRQEGRLIRLFAVNNEYLKRGESIGWIESNASHEEVLKLSKMLDSSLSFLYTNKNQNISKIFDLSFRNLGELQQAYQKFILAKQLYNDYAKNGFYVNKMDILQSDIKSLSSLSQNLLKQKSLTELDLLLAKESFDINKILLDKKVITEGEYRNEKSKYVNKEKTIPQLEASLFANDIQKQDKNKEVLQLQHDINQQQTIFQQEIQNLKSQVDDWIRKYVIKSPIDGKVYYVTSMQEDRYLKGGTLIGYVNPKESEYYAETTLSQNNFGKLDTGMRVQLRFDAYPYEEWGIVEGKLRFISNIPTDSGFLSLITLEEGLITSDKRKLIYKNGLKANALIITQDMRLLERLYYSFIKSASIQNK